MKILAIDPGLATGWASNSGRVWGVQQFFKRPWRHPEAHFLDFRAWLLSKIENLEIDAIAYEAAFAFSNRGGNSSRLHWEGIILSVSAETNLPRISVIPSSLKKYATGNGRAERPEMRDALRARFQIDLAASEHDAIAAIWVLSWATQEARAGRIERCWSGKPRWEPEARRTLCNRCAWIFDCGDSCPRCGSAHVRREA